MSSLKLLHSGGNGVIIAPPDSNPASDLTLKLPQADGSAGQFMKTDGSGNLAFATVTDTNDFVKLQSQAGSDLGSALIFDNLDTATYRSFKLYFALLPDSSADGMYFYLRFRTGGASGADDTNSRYDFGYQHTFNEDNQSQIARNNFSYVSITHTAGGGASEGVSGFIDFALSRSGDGFTTGNGGSNAHWSVNNRNESGGHRHVHGNAVYNHSSAVNHTGIKLFTGTGGNAAGAWENYQYTLYGLKG